MNTSEMKILLTKYVSFIDGISLKYQYPDNIKHLLYVIVPAFVIKYGLKREHFILNCLNEIPIVITGKEDPRYQALYVSYPYKENTIKTKKRIYLNRYNNIPFLQLIDNLVHEFNHAINSFKNEVTIKDDIFYLRTGLAKTSFNKDTLEIIEKEKTYVLEEIINSKQTELIIDIIKKLKDLNIEDVRIQNTLEAVKNSVDDKYISSSYFSMKYYCQELLNNKTFLLTIENLRIDGNIDDIEYWFDGIYGDKGYKTLVNLLYQMIELQNKKGFFVKRKIKDTALQLVKMSKQFNQNCNLK